MNLVDYIKQQGGTAVIGCPVLASIASDCECSHRTLYMIALGHKQAGPKLARVIEKETRRQVTVNDLRPDIFGPPPANDEPIPEVHPPRRRSKAVEGEAAAADGAEISALKEARNAA